MRSYSYGMKVPDYGEVEIKRAPVWIIKSRDHILVLGLERTKKERRVRTLKGLARVLREEGLHPRAITFVLEKVSEAPAECDITFWWLFYPRPEEREKWEKLWIWWEW